jgi:ubiquinone/menaquinone biosynthesis C-methylase UbiE
MTPTGVYRTLWAPTFARFYDTAFSHAERSGLRAIRSSVVGQASGVTVELGAGTGLNLAHYPSCVSRLLLTEPDPYMASQLRAKAAASAIDSEIVEAPADALPVDDASVDTVVSTLVLCTVSDPAAALAEVARVLRPGGQFLFVEHVRSESPRVARWQDRLHTPWSWCACGCQCNRDTVTTIRQSPLDMQDLRRGELRWLTPLLRALAIGVARR